MAMPINALMMNEGETVYYDDDFRRMLETHSIWLKDQPETRVLPIDPHTAMKYKGDLFGLLNSMRILPQYHYAVMVINEIPGPQSNTEQLKSLIIPDSGFLDVLRARYKIVSKKST